jgi:hypothetical protein
MFNIKRLLYTPVGKILISVILGLGMASLFRTVCNNQNCMEFRGPIIDDVKDRIFQYGDDCYKYKQRATTCDESKKIIELSSKTDREAGVLDPILDIPAPKHEQHSDPSANTVFSFLNGRGGV